MQVLELLPLLLTHTIAAVWERAHDDEGSGVSFEAMRLFICGHVREVIQ